jgi:hypothetical protein
LKLLRMELAVDPNVLTFVAAAFRDQMKHAGITIDDLASAFIDLDTAELERRLGRRVLPAELLRAQTRCRRVMDLVIRNALDELREALMAALMKIADDGVAPERNE